MSAKSVVRMRSVMVELPEDMMVRLVRRARDEGLTVHALAVKALTDWVSK